MNAVRTDVADAAAPAGPGHNSGAAGVRFTVKLFSTLASRLPGAHRGVGCSLPAGSRIADLLDHLRLARGEVFLVLVNGKDVSPGRVGDPVKLDRLIEEGDVIALTGPLPYSWGYGAPVV